MNILSKLNNCNPAQRVSAVRRKYRKGTKKNEKPESRVSLKAMIATFGVAIALFVIAAMQTATAQINPTVSVAETSVCVGDSIHLNFTGTAPFALEYKLNSGNVVAITVYGSDTVVPVNTTGVNRLIVRKLSDGGGAPPQIYNPFPYSTGDVYYYNGEATGVVFSPSNGGLQGMFVSFTQLASGYPNPMGQSYTGNPVLSSTSGRQNMLDFITSGKDINLYPPLKYCDTLTLGGYTDWFLGSLSEWGPLNSAKTTVNNTLSANGSSTLGGGGTYFWTSNYSSDWSCYHSGGYGVTMVRLPTRAFGDFDHTSDTPPLTFTFTVLAKSTYSYSASICYGDTYSFGGQTLATSGTYKDTLTSMITGCDSIVTLTLTVRPQVSVTIDETSVCHNDSVHLHFTGTAPFTVNYGFNGSTNTITVQRNDTAIVATLAGNNPFVINSLTDNNGCVANTLSQNIFVKTNIDVEITDTICYQERANYNKNGFTLSNLAVGDTIVVDTIAINDLLHCDSITTLKLHVLAFVDTVEIISTVVYGTIYSANNFTTTGTENVGIHIFTRTDNNTFGCDSTTRLTLTVVQDTVAVVWSDTTFVYDGSAHKPSAKFVDVGGNNVVLAISTTQTNAGNFTATVLVSAGGANYYLTNTSFDWEITTKAITVTADAKTKTYGDNDPTLTYTVNPALIAGDNFIGALIRVVGENVGTYAINQGTLSAGSNYTITYNDDTLTIT
ncbi:MAG: hypothetical protein LBR36_01045, partial [Bacteroidales bacterium]|nr:hypothetical protein [Bacteroidales bacterium]